jgi:hypothetical protein
MKKHLKMFAQSSKIKIKLETMPNIKSNSDKFQLIYDLIRVES